MSPTQSLQSTINASCRKLEETGAMMGVALKQNTDSVMQLEEILSALADFGADESTMRGATFMVGAYLGEILRLKLGGDWEASSDGGLTLKISDTSYALVDKVRKFVANPGGDSLVFFTNAVLTANA